MLLPAKSTTRVWAVGDAWMEGDDDDEDPDKRGVAGKSGSAFIAPEGVRGGKLAFCACLLTLSMKPKRGYLYSG